MRNISIAFGGFAALSSVDFRSEGHSVHALTGANGAGKSTLMAILSGAHSHYSGEILLDGRVVSLNSTHQAEKHGISIIFQELNLFPNMNVMFKATNSYVLPPAPTVQQ